jgi:parallel beta-helix repeat protein
MTIQFAKAGTYWSDYTLLLRKRSGNVTGGIVGNMWRSLPSFDASNVTLDLNGSTIVQRTVQPWRWGGGEVLDARKRWGNPMIFTSGATNVRITNGFLVGSATGGRYDPNREDWMGILIGGENDDDIAQNMKVDHLGIRNVWGDFIYLASQTSRGKLLKDVTIEDNTMTNAGRQGIVIHGGNNLLIQRNNFTNVKRYLFDSEPAPAHGWKDVTITANTGESGNLGYFQFMGNKVSMASGLSITNNTIVKGHLAMEIGNGSPALRVGATITGNRSLEPTAFRRNVLHRYLISISRWSDVTIANNSDRIVANSQPYAIDTSKSSINVGTNNWGGL